MYAAFALEPITDVVLLLPAHKRLSIRLPLGADNGVMRFHAGKPAYTQEEVAQGMPSFLQKQCETDTKLGEWKSAEEGGLDWTWHNTSVPSPSIQGWASGSVISSPCCPALT